LGTDQTFVALADSTRRAILDLLREHGSMTAGHIASRFAISRPAVSKHLRVLREARLVRTDERGREIHYSLDAAPIGQVQRDWLDAFAPHWERSLERLKQQSERRKPGVEGASGSVSGVGSSRV
jgi:DNA-binding transcriptional ArsR family regulator